MTPPALVLLDLDGTLLDHDTSVRGALAQWVGRLDPPLRPADLTETWLAAERRHFPAWRAGVVSFAEQRRRRLRDVLPALGLTVGDDDALDDVFTGYLEAYAASWTAFDDVADALDGLATAGLTTAVLTNGVEAQQHAKVAALGLAGRTGPVLTAEALGAAKPHAAAFRGACSRLGVAPADVVMVGDDHAVDVLAARAAGLRAVHVDRTGTGVDAGAADPPVRDLRALAGALGGRPRHHAGPTGCTTTA